MKAFFDLIRRLNSLLLFGAFVGLAAILIWAAWSNSGSNRQDELTVSSPSGSKETLHFHLEDIQVIPGVNTQLLMLTVTRVKSGFAYSDRDKEIRNILFLVGDEKADRWLFPHQKNVIHDAHPLLAKVESRSTSSQEGLAKALYIEYSDKDTNGDGEITKKDKVNVGLTKADGSGLVVALTGIDRVFSVSMLGDQTISVLYQTGKAFRHAQYSVATLAQVSDHEIVAIPDVG